MAPLSAVSDQMIAGKIEALLARRGPGKSICPSEVARALAEDLAGERALTGKAADAGEATDAGEEADWRALMPHIRRVAAALCAEGRLRATQRARETDPLSARGPIRLRAPL